MLDPKDWASLHPKLDAIKYLTQPNKADISAES